MELTPCLVVMQISSSTLIDPMSSFFFWKNQLRVITGRRISSIPCDINTNIFIPDYLGSFSAVVQCSHNLIKCFNERKPSDLIYLPVFQNWVIENLLGGPPWSSGSVLDYRSLPPMFESQCGHIWRMFHLWLCFITFGGRSAHLAYHVHKNSCKTPIIIIIENLLNVLHCAHFVRTLLEMIVYLFYSLCKFLNCRYFWSSFFCTKSKSWAKKCVFLMCAQCCRNCPQRPCFFPVITEAPSVPSDGGFFTSIPHSPKWLRIASKMPLPVPEIWMSFKKIVLGWSVSWLTILQLIQGLWCTTIAVLSSHIIVTTESDL